MVIFEIQSYIETIEKNSSLYEEKNFDKRMEVIDFIGFQVIDPIEGILRRSAHPDELTSLKCRAEKVKSQLEEIDSKLIIPLSDDAGADERPGTGNGILSKNACQDCF